MTRVVATIQARMGSSRLPGKVLLPAANAPLLLHMARRVARARYLDALVIATGDGPADDPIAALCRQHGLECFRGDPDHVLRRVVDAGRAHAADVSVVLTGDCPLMDPVIVDQHVTAFLAARPHVAYASNCEVRSYFHGLDLQVTDWATLADSLRRAESADDREHVGWYIRRHPGRYPRLDVVAPPGLSRPFLRLTLDDAEDHARIAQVYDALWPSDPEFTAADVIALAEARGWTACAPSTARAPRPTPRGDAAA